jgi:hypothetical protein
MWRRRVEVLVVIAIIGALIGLLAPAVMRVRDAAARMTCHGRFCMLSIALHNYADSHDGAYPSGTVLHPDLPPDQRLSWLVLLLPYLSEDDIFKQFDPWRGPGDARNERAASNRLRHVVCPASGEHRWDNYGEYWKSATPITHYVGVAGVGADAATLSPGAPRAGVFGHDRRTPLKDGFPDGTSNTLMLIETGRNPGHWAYGGTATVRAFEGELPYIGPQRPFGGFHSGPYTVFTPRERLCNGAFADGSYRTLTDRIDPAVLEALATIGGREELPPNW